MPQEAFPKGILTGADPNAEIAETTPPFPNAEDIVRAHYETGDSERAQAQGSRKDWSRDEVTNIAEKSLKEIRALENAANDQGRWMRISPDVAKTIKHIVVFSAPGTYAQPVKNDRWQEKKWAWGMDRYRDDRAARLGIVLAGRAEGRDYEVFDSQKSLNANDPAIKDLREEAKDLVARSGIRFAYIGRPDEGAAVQHALKDAYAFIPEDRVDIIAGPDIDNTMDQVRALKTYLHTSNVDGGVVFVAHGPQLVRMAGLLAQSEAIPKNVNTYFEPLPIPRLGMNEYPFMETKGKLFNVVAGTSTADSCPYSVLGHKNP